MHPDLATTDSPPTNTGAVSRLQGVCCLSTPLSCDSYPPPNEAQARFPLHWDSFSIYLHLRLLRKWVFPSASLVHDSFLPVIPTEVRKNRPNVSATLMGIWEWIFLLFQQHYWESESKYSFLTSPGETPHQGLMDTHCLIEGAPLQERESEVLDPCPGEVAGPYHPLKPWVSKGLSDFRKSLPCLNWSVVSEASSGFLRGLSKQPR